MLLHFHQQTVDNFLIPSFSLAKGEILIIQHPNVPFFHSVKFELIDIITGKVTNDRIEISASFKYAEHFKESWLRSHFLPVTVGEYLDKYANKTNPVYKKIYDIEWMTSNIKMQALAGNPRRQLSIYTALSWTSNLIFDLVGTDPQGGRDIFDFVKKAVGSGGSAVLFDDSDQFKTECTTSINAKYIGDKK